MKGIYVKIVLSLVIASVSIAVILFVVKLMELRESYIDLTPLADTHIPENQPVLNGRTLRFAVATIVSAETTFSTYHELVRKIGRDTGRHEVFIMRPSYRTVRQDLERGRVDLAFVCTGTYTHSSIRGHVKLLVQPEFENEYTCMIIVPADSPAVTLDDLRGCVMAFTDPESHTGCVVPTVAIADRGYDPGTFFKKVIFTGSHDRSILAVSAGIVDAAAVNSLVWKSILREDPTLSDRVRILWNSETFGPPAVLVPSGLDDDIKESLLRAFLTFHETDEGREILSTLMIRKFVRGRDEDYQTAVEVNERFESLGDIRWP